MSKQTHEHDPMTTADALEIALEATTSKKWFEAHREIIERLRSLGFVILPIDPAWHPIDPATIPRGRRIMLWGRPPNPYAIFAIARKEVDYVRIWENHNLCEFSDFTHWAECPAGPNGER